MSVFKYYCRECNSPATKEPTAKGHSGLHGWKCTGNCKGKIRVKREKS